MESALAYVGMAIVGDAEAEARTSALDVIDARRAGRASEAHAAPRASVLTPEYVAATVARIEATP